MLRHGEVKPFDFGFDDADDNAPLPDIMPVEEPKNKMSPEQINEINKTAPSIQGYNPQINTNIPTTHGNEFSYIQNDSINNNTDPNYQAPDFSYINNQNNGFNNSATNNFGGDHDFNAPLDPFDFSEEPPAAPMRFSDFDSAPAPSPAPKRSWSTGAPQAAKAAPAPKATPNNAQVNPVSTEHSKVIEKTNAFGKKKIDVEVTPLDQRSDTWTSRLSSDNTSDKAVPQAINTGRETPLGRIFCKSSYP